MKTGRTVPVAGLLLAVGIVGYLAGRADRRPSEARAAESPAAPAAAHPPQRFGAMIGLRPEKKDEYVRLHAHTWPEILALLNKCHVQHYSIYMGELGDKLYLFSYFEYTGDDLAKDMAVMKADPKMHEWWKLTDPCQIRLPDTKEGDWWKNIPEVFHMD